MHYQIRKRVVTFTLYSSQSKMNTFLRENKAEYTSQFVQRDFYGDEYTITLPHNRTQRKLITDFLDKF